MTHTTPKGGWPGIVGLDLSKQTLKGCRLSGEGHARRRNFSGKMTMDGEGFGKLLERIEPGDLVIMEAGSSSFNLARYLMEHSRAQVVVLNPADLRLIWGSQRKTDKADAMKLACIGRDMPPDTWPTVSVPTEEEQARRSAVTYYVSLKQEETRAFNRLFALFNSVGHPDIDKARCKEDRDYRDSLVADLLHDLALRIGNDLCETIDLVQAHLENMKDELVDICVSEPEAALAWLSMPGVGLVNAATLVAYVGDGSRFSSGRQLVNYAGLVPKVSQSGTVDVHGRITKRGVPAIRRNIVQGAGAVVIHRYRPECPLSSYAYRKKKEKGCFGKASVAVAAKMLRIGYALLRDKQLYHARGDDGYAALKRKLAFYKLSALIDYLPQSR